MVECCFVRLCIQVSHDVHFEALFGFVVWWLYVFVGLYVKVMTAVKFYASACLFRLWQFHFKDYRGLYLAFQELQYLGASSLTSYGIGYGKMFDIGECIEVPKAYYAYDLIVLCFYEVEHKGGFFREWLHL